MRSKKHILNHALLALGSCLAASSLSALAASPPVVTGVTALQRAGTKLVDIAYTISDPDSTTVNIGILMSKDSGATWTVPAATFSSSNGGAPGVGIAVSATPTVKNVVWDAGADWDGHYNPLCRVRVIACDNGMVLIPAGSYLRGNPSALGDSDVAYAPQYSVYVSEFLMDSKLVTRELWIQVKEGYADLHGYTFDNEGSYKAANHPVQTVNWYDCVKWCNARSQMEGVTPVYYTDAGFTSVYKSGQNDSLFVKPGANGYRLPTEAEWEKAARGGATGHRFPWSDADTISGSRANYLGDPAVSYDSGPYTFNPSYATGGFPYTSPVGLFPANGYNLYDMAGNVYERCYDWYAIGYYASGQTNPQGPSSGNSRVRRGGAWLDGAITARCAWRLNDPPTFAANYTGFRCVKGL